MSSKIGASIALEGEREYRKALSEINAGLKVTASELTLVTAKFSDNAKSVEALTARNAALQKQINGQTDKVSKLREALTNSITIYGEADAKTLKWKTSLNNAETELIKMQKELDKGEKELKDFGNAQDESAEKGKGLGSVLNNIIGALGIHLPAGADKAITALDAQKASTLALIGVSAAIVTGFGKTTIATARYADELLTLSAVTGMSTDTLQEFNYAAELIDVSTETMTGSMSKMIRSMDAARGGSKETQQAFRDLHVSITNNGQLKDSETMFYEIIDALGKVGNETERDALAMQIFGRSARELNPLISVGSKRLKELGIEAQNMGYVMDSGTLDSFGRLEDAMQKFNNQGQSVKNSIAIVLLPVLTDFFEILNLIDPKVLATVAIIGSIAIVAVTVVKSIGDITNTFSLMNPATLKTTAIIVGVTAALIALAAIIAVIVGKGDDLNKTMVNVGNSVGNMASTVNGAGSRIGKNATGTSNWRGGLTWVGEEGPELIDAPPGTRILNNRQSMQLAFAGASSGESNNFYGDVIIPAKDLKEMQDVADFFKRIKQVSRQGVK